MKNNIPTKLKEIRKSKKLSTFKVARKTGALRRYIINMGKGLVEPSDPMLIALEDLYHMPLFELYGRIRPANIDEVMKCPALRSTFVECTTNKNALSQDSLDEIYEEIIQIYNNHYKKAEQY